MRKFREGLVVSDRMNKTIIVVIRDRAKHPLYKKTIIKTKRIKAHDENNECGIGDTVLISETRPISKDKHWRLVRIVEKAK
ncbi:MAG: 30S ribosomal protein S17 [Firmicutes bacterium]|nr:30S ribosomal protein S17 [Bacillota bacterium]